jgi:hypothetical protein
MVASIRLSRRLSRLEDARCARDEMELRRRLHRDLAAELRRRDLASVAGVREASLLDRLSAAGFGPGDVSALIALPIARAAWGSGSVTSREFRAAIDAILHHPTPENSSAIRRFRHWLERRPSESLWALWGDFTAARLRGMPVRRHREEGRMLYGQARAVALASGGWLGQGQICAGEQRVLDQLAGAYGLEVDVD